MTQIQEASHSTEASESVQDSQGNVQDASASVEHQPTPSEPVKGAQDSKDADKSDGGEGGQVPPSHTDQPSTGSPSATITSVVTAPSEVEHASGAHEEKDQESSSATLSLTVPILRKRTRRRDRSVSEGKYAGSNTTEGSPSVSEAEPKTKKTKASLLTKITQIFTSCVIPSHRTHAIELDEGPSHGRADQKDAEKHSTKDVEMAEPQPTRETSSSPAGVDISRTLSLSHSNAFRDR